MSTEPSQASLSEKLVFSPLHRTAEVENIHAQVIQNEQQQPVESAAIPSTRRILVKHLTVIGDGSDIDRDNPTR